MASSSEQPGFVWIFRLIVLAVLRGDCEEARKLAAEAVRQFPTELELKEDEGVREAMRKPFQARPVVNTETGETYSSQLELADKLRVSNQTVRRHIETGEPLQGQVFRHAEGEDDGI